MRSYEVTVRDMWMHGKSIVLLVDINIDIPVKIRVGDKIEECTRKLTCIPLEYEGKHDFNTLASIVYTGKKILMGITRDFQYCTTQQEFKFCV